jgi:hypothetical protein
VRPLENGDDAPIILCLGCGPRADEEGFARVGRPVIPRPVGGTIGDAIGLAKVDRFQALENNEKKNKKNKFLSGDDNESDLGPSECIVIPLIQSCGFRGYTDGTSSSSKAARQL